MTIKTKYSRGDSIFTIFNCKVVELNISTIKIEVNYKGISVMYRTTSTSDVPSLDLTEDKIFSSRKDLIASL